MLKSSMQLCQNIHEYSKDDNKYQDLKDLQEELNDLKAMLEMQAIINQEQEGKLQKINEEKENLACEKNYCISKISIMEKEVNDNITTMETLKERVAELEEILTKEKKNLEELHDKVQWLTIDNKNLLQSIEKKVYKIDELECQLEDERTFYAQEKSRYCKEMKRRRNHTTEVQTDNSNLDDESICTQKSGSESPEIKQLKALYRHQLITTCLICEKYIKLCRFKSVLLSRLSQTTKEYKQAMVDIMLEFDTCKAEYSSLLEDKLNEDGSDNLLKIVNRSNRLASDNAVLKQELLRLKNHLILQISYRNMKGSSSIIQNERFNNNDEVSDYNEDVSSRINSNSTLPKIKRRRKSKTMKKRKNSTDSNKIYYSSAPASSESDSSDYSETNSKNSMSYITSLTKHNEKGFSESSNVSFSDSSDPNLKQNFNHVNVCPSFISFSSDSSIKENIKDKHREKDVKRKNKISNSEENVYEIENKTEKKKSKLSENNRNLMNHFKILEKDEPAYLQVTCDEIRTSDLKSNCTSVKMSTKKSDSLKDDLQEWLAKTPIIECSEWSKSIQGADIIKAASAPELDLVNPKSLFKTPKYKVSADVKK